MESTRKVQSVEAVASFVRGGLYAVLLVSPLPFGAVRGWSVASIEVAAAAIGMAALWIVHREPDALSPSARRLLLPAGLLILIGAAQLVPLPVTIRQWVAAPATELRDALTRVVPEAAGSLVPQSLSPPDTVDAVLRLCAYLLLGLAAAVAFRQRRHVRTAAIVIVCSGAFQALYGSVEYLSGHQHIFGYEKKYYLESASGTFINRNHFAGYLAVTLPFALAAWVDRPTRSTAEEWRHRVLHWLQPSGVKALLLGSASLPILIGIFLSYSRGGLAAALVGVAVLALMTGPSRKKYLAFGLAFLLPVAFLSWQELRAPGERFVSQATELPTLNGRLPLWQAGARMIPPHAAMGTGLGTFEPAFRLYHPAHLEKRLTHVHNDWLEALIEGGVGALLLLVWLAGGVWRAVQRGLGPDTRRSSLAASILAGIAAIAFHSAIDFPVRIPANAVLLSILVGLAAGAWAGGDEAVTTFQRRGTRPPREVTG